MTKYTEKDAAKETDTSIKEVKEAWHYAKDQAGEEGGWGVPEDRHSGKPEKKKDD